MSSLSRAVTKAVQQYKSRLARLTPGRYALEEKQYYLGTYHQIGIYSDDVVPAANKRAIECVRRLPSDVRNERDFRFHRARQLQGRKQILPSDQHIKFEDNAPYLEPYFELINLEDDDRYSWDSFSKASVYKPEGIRLAHH